MPPKKTFGAAAHHEPLALQYFRTTLIHGYGLVAFRTNLGNRDFSLADDFFFVAMQHCMSTNDIAASADFIKTVRDAKAPISPSTWDKIYNHAVADERYEIAGLVNIARTAAIAELPPAPNHFAPKDP